jgi:hypothetical protein
MCYFDIYLIVVVFLYGRQVQQQRDLTLHRSPSPTPSHYHNSHTLKLLLMGSLVLGGNFIAELLSVLSDVHDAPIAHTQLTLLRVDHCLSSQILQHQMVGLEDRSYSWVPVNKICLQNLGCL